MACHPYIRVPAVGTHQAFIEGLSDAVVSALARERGACPAAGWDMVQCGPICPAKNPDQRTKK